MRRRVSRPVMPVMRTSISTRSGLNLGITFNPSSPLAAVANSMSGESKIRWMEYRTSSSSSINRSLLILAEDSRFRPKKQRIFPAIFALKFRRHRRRVGDVPQLQQKYYEEKSFDQSDCLDVAGPLLAADSNPKDDVKNAAAALVAKEIIPGGRRWKFPLIRRSSPARRTAKRRRTAIRCCP